MRTKPIYSSFKDIDFSNAEGNAHEINVKPTATAPAELQLYSHLKVIPYSSTQYQVVKAKPKAGGAPITPTTKTLINISDVVEAKHEHKKHEKASNAEGHHHHEGERRRERQQQQSQYGQPGYGQGQYGQQGSGAYQQQIAAEMAQMGQQYMDPNGASESYGYGYAEGGASKTPTWAKFLFIPGAILGGVLAWHFAKGKAVEGNAKYLHYGKFISLGALAFNVPQIIFEVKPLLAKKAS